MTFGTYSVIGLHLTDLPQLTMFKLTRTVEKFVLYLCVIRFRWDLGRVPTD